MIRCPRISIGGPLAVLAAGALSACGTTIPQNQSLYSERQPVVERNNYAFDVNAGGGGMPAAERQRLAAWFEALNLRYGDRVTIDDPAMSAATREDIAALTGRYGLTVSDAPAPVTPGYVAPGNARVVVTRSTASVPGCPDWSSQMEWNPKNGTHPNYGCATNSNLAAMIADPEDLVRGQQAQEGDATLYGLPEPSGQQVQPPAGTNP